MNGVRSCPPYLGGSVKWDFSCSNDRNLQLPTLPRSSGTSPAAMKRAFSCQHYLGGCGTPPAMRNGAFCCQLLVFPLRLRNFSCYEEGSLQLSSVGLNLEVVELLLIQWTESAAVHLTLEEVGLLLLRWTELAAVSCQPYLGGCGTSPAPMNGAPDTDPEAPSLRLE